ncbi:MAG: hypothetical protein R2681_00295 [Pyrinomonadaceae bacterium]
MTRTLIRIVAFVAIVAPTLHLISDIMEWSIGGYSRIQLLINYMGFVPVPFLILGLYAVQRPKIGLLGLTGSILYGIAFIYFAHTTLFAYEESFANYEALWDRLGNVYTFHGGLMVFGGLLFGFASLKVRVLGQKWIILFIFGLSLNFVLAFLPIPDVIQTIGSLFRNIGMIGIGFGLMGSVETADIPSLNNLESDTNPLEHTKSDFI